jgi:uncharacterized protein YidB (DUF937 family)
VEGAQQKGHTMGLLDQVLGGGSSGGGQTGGMSPITMALLGLLAYRTAEGKGRLAEMLGRSPSGSTPGASAPPLQTGPGGPAATGGLGGLLGGLLGGGATAGGILSTGLGDLLKHFQQNGQGDKAQSWISSGPSKSITSGEMEQGLGEDKIAWLMQQTGMSRDDLLKGLSRELPAAVDKLTPEGRLPTEQEAARMV